MSRRKELKALKKEGRGAGRGSVLRKIARAGATRRKLQSLILILVTGGSVASAVLAAQLLVSVNASFDHAFARQNGSQLTVSYGGAGVSAGQIASTAHANGVTAASGPFPEVRVSHYTAGGASGPDQGGGPLPSMSVVGRADPGGPVDDVQLESGHWPTAPNQIVVDTGASILDSFTLGSTLTLQDAPGQPTLTIVGDATSVSQTADAWVLPSEIAAISVPHKTPGYEMLYRFTSADTVSQLAADENTVTAGLPRGVTSDSQTWLVLQAAAEKGGDAIIPPFLAVFGVLGVVLAVIILSSMVGASIATSAKRIGILKALGCTPAQVIRAYCMQALIPCVVGVVAGTAAGTYGAQILLRSTGRALNTGTPPLSTSLEVLVPLASLALVMATAVLSAGRAGRMSVLDAIATGHTPHARRGRRVQLLLARSPLPRSVSLGLASSFSRPARALALTVAMAMGVLAATLAVGVWSSLNQASSDVSSQGTGDKGIQVYVGSADPGAPTPAQEQQAVAAIKARPGTEAYYTDYRNQMPVDGLSQDATIEEYSGDSSWAHYPLISGNWLSGSGQAVVSTHLMQAMNLHLGSVLTVNADGTRVPLTVVGQVFDTEDEGLGVLTEEASFASLQPQVPAFNYYVELKPGTDQTSYLTALNQALAPAASNAGTAQSGGSKLKLVIGTLSVSLTLMLLAVAALGVVGSVVLDTRERVHDIGVYKALGMTPRQTTNMVLTSVLWLGVFAGILGVALGYWLHGLVLPLMGDAVQQTLPPDVLSIYRPAELALFAASGILVALVSALGPSTWAGRIRTASALRTE